MSFEDDFKPGEEFDFSNAKRGVFSTYVGAGKLVVIEQDLTERFPDSEAVNAALRAIVESGNIPKKAS